jgi:hypothetical protein
VRRIVGLCDESVDDLCDVEKGEMTTLQTGGFGPAPEIGAPLAPFRFADRVKPLSRFSHMQIIIDTRDLVIQIRSIIGITYCRLF